MLCSFARLFVIFDWTSVIAKVTGHLSLKDKLRWVFGGMHYTIWISWTVFSLLQAIEDKMYLWRASMCLIHDWCARLNA